MYRLIQNGQLLIDDQLVKRDIAIDEKGRITAIEAQITPTDEPAETIFDAQGALVSAGLIDGHVHFRDPGFTDKETLQTGSRAAAHGGYTSVIAMPNLNQCLTIYPISKH